MVIKKILSNKSSFLPKIQPLVFRADFTTAISSVMLYIFFQPEKVSLLFNALRESNNWIDRAFLTKVLSIFFSYSQLIIS